MQHKCLQCHQNVELPDGHRLVVCPACGTVQDGLSPSQVPPLPPKPTAAKANPAGRGFRLWALIAAGIAAAWFVTQISAPSRNANTEKTEPVTTADARDLQSAKLALKDLITYTDAFNREMQTMPYTAHVDLPALSQRMQVIMDDAATVKVPYCASNVKNQMMLSMTHGQGAVKLNYAAGQGMNHPSVLEQIGNATRAVAEAQTEMTKLKC